MEQYILTREELKKKIRRTNVGEILSALELKLCEHGVNVKDQDLIELADTAQVESGPKALRFTRLLNNKNIEAFHKTGECSISSEVEIDVILVNEIYFCKEVKNK